MLHCEHSFELIQIRSAQDEAQLHSLALLLDPAYTYIVAL